jgi:hypothetical protein
MIAFARVNMKGPSPLLGYNTNVRHGGKLFHIQTEDSGLKHPHIITHLFADGGRIIASRKTSYAEHVGAENVQEVVKQLMREQHKAMFIALRDGEYDEGEVEAIPIPLDEITSEVPVIPIEPRDTDALERAAARFETTAGGRPAPAVTPGLYRSTRPAVEVAGRGDSRPPESIFGSDLLSEKSLDEVILSYLSEDLDESSE